MNDEERLMVEELERVEAEERRLQMQPHPQQPPQRPQQPPQWPQQPPHQQLHPHGSPYPIFQGHIPKENVHYGSLSYHDHR